jgi:hypothetical protein
MHAAQSCCIERRVVRPARAHAERRRAIDRVRAATSAASCSHAWEPPLLEFLTSLRRYVAPWVPMHRIIAPPVAEAATGAESGQRETWARAIGRSPIRACTSRPVQRESAPLAIVGHPTKARAARRNAGRGRRRAIRQSPARRRRLAPIRCASTYVYELIDTPANARAKYCMAERARSRCRRSHRCRP